MSLIRSLSLLATVSVLALRALGEELETPTPPTIEGTWRWKFVMPDGSIANPRLTLTLKEGALAGTSSFRAGSETAITNVALSNGDLRFQVIRERDGRDIVTTYSGRWSGDTIQGTIESNWSGERQTYDWHAERIKGATGVWKWSTAFGDRSIELQVTLRQEGAKLDGALAPRRGRGGRGGQPTKIQNGSVKEDGELYFEVATGSTENRRVTKYKGKFSGDTIKGTIESSSGEHPGNPIGWPRERIEQVTVKSLAGPCGMISYRLDYVRYPLVRSLAQP